MAIARKFLFLAALFLLALQAPARADDVATAPASAAASYKLGTGDQIKVTVFGQDDLAGQSTVDDLGQVRLPLIGQVQAAGLTVHELEEVITTRLLDGYLKSPKVSVEVTNYRPFYIIGEVNKPGEYPYVNGMNILNAVAMAGGFTYRANDTEVYVRRKGGSVEEKAPADETTLIRPGDIVRIAERFF